jgi:hypothetical protein
MSVYTGMKPVKIIIFTFNYFDFFQLFWNFKDAFYRISIIDLQYIRCLTSEESITKGAVMCYKGSGM